MGDETDWWVNGVGSDNLGSSLTASARHGKKFALERNIRKRERKKLAVGHFGCACCLADPQLIADELHTVAADGRFRCNIFRKNVIFLEFDLRLRHPNSSSHNNIHNLVLEFVWGQNSPGCVGFGSVPEPQFPHKQVSH
ncbi:hypothetical protein Pmani_036828 [Petrolisthes manimaculis]|uniref:Uncharacterized protein n=1 Tax=Petrolisthes manimaculis TaxID=1843537 RepID=A0AAE1NJD7_9EUCA|nr:hypothetical protein Pmani_036828 [Petrolisthes manimaculis]